MYEEKYVTLPGGFVLPLGIIIERYIQHTPTTDTAPTEDTLRQIAERYLTSQMIAGTVVRSDVDITLEDGVWILNGRYVCQEMIGREQNEEIITP